MTDEESNRYDLMHERSIDAYYLSLENPDMYYAIVRMFDDLSDWEIIDGYDDETSAEEAAEHYSERFPQAVIDVQPVYN